VAVAAECLKVQVYEAKQQKLSLSFTIGVTLAAITVQPVSAPLVSLVAALVHVLGQRQRRLDKLLFNLTNPTLAAMVASIVYLRVESLGTTDITWRLIAALVAVMTFYTVNIGGVVLMISLTSGRDVSTVIRETTWFAPTNILLGLTGAFVGAAHQQLGPFGVVMFVVPVLVMRFTLALYARQSEQTIATLQAARAEAEATVRAREEFLSIASHELRTPLTTIKGYVQMLARSVRQPTLNRDRIAEQMANLHTGVNRLETLVVDLLDSARIQQNRLELRAEPTDLSLLAQHVVARFDQAETRTAGHTLVCDAPMPVTGRWDAARLDQVLTNLVSNALKYSPNGGVVHVRVRQAATQAVVTVSDQGVGITPEDQATLFQPFARGSATERAFPGVGLGLYIASQIVERHGGQVRLHSAVGTGTTVTVHLPLNAPA
jgi:signal transduction histidine kinase